MDVVTAKLYECQLTPQIPQIRKDFPLLHQELNKKPLIYLDNAASTQKPITVIEATNTYYREQNANIHRGVYTLSEKATEAYEQTRDVVKDFIGAASRNEIIFTKGTTEAINLIAYSFGKKFIKAGDEVLITEMEHHSNIVPWQIMCEDRGAILKVVPINERGELEMDQFFNLLSEKTKIVSVVHVSNSLGTINPVKEIIDAAHEVGAKVLIDGAQSVQHLSVDVQQLDCDFFTFSGHKIYGPTGIGILYGKEQLLDELPPYQGGGDMIKSVSFEKTVYNDLPFKFEAGTPNIAGVIGLKAALKYLLTIGQTEIAEYEHQLLQYATDVFKRIDGMRIIGTSENKAGAISFLLNEIHPYDAGVILDKLGICIRTGHHCTQPIMDKFDLPGTCRASFSFYNTKEEIDILAEGLDRVKQIFQ